MLRLGEQPESLYTVLQKAKPTWSSDDLNKVHEKLRRVNIVDVESLGQAVARGSLNSLLASAGERRLKSTTLQQLSYVTRMLQRATPATLGRLAELDAKLAQDLCNPFPIRKMDNAPITSNKDARACFADGAFLPAGGALQYRLGVHASAHLPGKDSQQSVIQHRAQSEIDPARANTEHAKPHKAPYGTVEFARRPLQSVGRGIIEAKSVAHLQTRQLEQRAQMQHSRSEPSFVDKCLARIASDGQDVERSSIGMVKPANYHQSSAKALASCVPMKAGGMRRDDDALEELLRQASGYVHSGHLPRSILGTEIPTSEQIHQSRRQRQQQQCQLRFLPPCRPIYEQEENSNEDVDVMVDANVDIEAVSESSCVPIACIPDDEQALEIRRALTSAASRERNDAIVLGSNDDTKVDAKSGETNEVSDVEEESDDNDACMWQTLGSFGLEDGLPSSAHTMERLDGTLTFTNPGLHIGLDALATIRDEQWPNSGKSSDTCSGGKGFFIQFDGLGCFSADEEKASGNDSTRACSSDADPPSRPKSASIGAEEQTMFEGNKVVGAFPRGESIGVEGLAAQNRAVSGDSTSCQLLCTNATNGRSVAHTKISRSISVPNEIHARNIPAQNPCDVAPSVGGNGVAPHSQPACLHLLHKKIARSKSAVVASGTLNGKQQHHQFDSHDMHGKEGDDTAATRRSNDVAAKSMVQEGQLSSDVARRPVLRRSRTPKGSPIYVPAKKNDNDRQNQAAYTRRMRLVRMYNGPKYPCSAPQLYSSMLDVP